MAIKGFEKKDPMQQFNQMMQIINQMNQMQDRKSRRYMGMYDEFAKNTKSFDNNVLERDLQRMNNYYDNNASGMSSQDIEYHNMVKNQYTDQIKANNDFDIDIERRHDYGQNMMDIADKYSSADDSWNFSWTESTINRDTGESTETTHGVDMPKAEDYEGGVNNPQYIKDNDEALVALGGVKGFERKRDDYKRCLKNELQKQIGGYSEYQELMVKKYAGSGRINNMHIKDFGELDESYQFIVKSLSDDGYFDDEEREAYQSAIMQKSYSPIKNFIAKDAEIKKYKRNNLMAEMDALENQGAIISDHLDKAFSAQGGAPGIDAAFTLYKKDNANWDGDDRTVTNNDIVNTINDKGKQDPELYQYLTSLEGTQKGILEKLKVKDQSFIKNDGGSYISSMEEQPWTASIRDIPQGRVPSMLGGTTNRLEDPEFNVSENLNKELSSSNIKVLDKDFEISNIQDKYKEGGDYASGGKKLNNEIDKLNQNIKDLENKPIRGERTNVGSNTFSPSRNTINDFHMWPKKSGGLGFGVGFKKALKGSDSSIPELKNILGHDNKEFTSSDLLKIEKKYNDDIETKNTLVNKYRSLRDTGVDKNSNEMIGLQNEINEIYQRWFAREEFDLGTWSKFKLTPGFSKKMDWNLALEDSGDYSEGATVLYKFKEFLRNRFDEDKNKIQEQSNRVAKIKKNLK